MSKIKKFAVFMLVTMVIGYVIGMQNESELEENRDQNVALIKQHLESGDFDSAISLASKYSFMSDDEITRLLDQAKQRKQVFEKREAISQLNDRLKNADPSDFKERLNVYRELAKVDPDNAEYLEQVQVYETKLEQSILTDLKKIPAAHYGENLSKYRELLALRPDNEKYISKVAYYEKEQQEFEKGFTTGKSAAERYVRQNMKNPDSYEHVSTKYFAMKDGFVFIVKYRGTNSFNAVVTSDAVVTTTLEGYAPRIVRDDAEIKDIVERAIASQ